MKGSNFCLNEFCKSSISSVSDGGVSLHVFLRRLYWTIVIETYFVYCVKEGMKS